MRGFQDDEEGESRQKPGDSKKGGRNLNPTFLFPSTSRIYIFLTFLHGIGIKKSKYC